MTGENGRVRLAVLEHQVEHIREAIDTHTDDEAIWQREVQLQLQQQGQDLAVLKERVARIGAYAAGGGAGGGGLAYLIAHLLERVFAP